MKKVFILAPLALPFMFFGWIAPSVAPSLPNSNALMSNSTNLALDLDRDWARATQRGDAARLEQILSDRLVYIHSNGVQETKQEFVGLLKSGGRRYLSIELLDPQALNVAGAGAVVNGKMRVKADFGGKPIDALLLYTHVYAVEKGKLRLLSHQTTTASAEPLSAAK